MPRRIYTYPPGIGWDTLNQWITAGAVVLGLGITISLLNFLISARSGAPAGKNPWQADTLEWEIESPPPPYARLVIGPVRSRHPLWEDPEREEPTREEEGLALSEGRLTLATSWLDARPVAIARMPEDTVAPLVLALLLAAMLAAFLLKSLWVALAVVVLCLAAVAVWLWPDRPAAEAKSERRP
jgi:hypothetical protein